jgi:hypothetical protein
LDSNLDIKIKRFSGVSSLLVNPKTVPTNSEVAKFKSIDQSDQMLRLTGKQRAEAGRGSGQYYICMFAHTFSSFSLIVTETSKSSKYDVI